MKLCRETFIIYRKVACFCLIHNHMYCTAPPPTHTHIHTDDKKCGIKNVPTFLSFLTADFMSLKENLRVTYTKPPPSLILKHPSVLSLYALLFICLSTICQPILSNALVFAQLLYQYIVITERLQVTLMTTTPCTTY